MKGKLSLYMLILVILVVAAVAFAASIFGRTIYLDGAINRARTVADNVNAFGAWVSQYGRVYVKDGSNKSFLGHETFRKLKGGAIMSFVPGEDGKTRTTFFDSDLEDLDIFSKNPALAQREFSEAVQKSEAKAKFRLTSDNYMNPANKPDDFERKAIAQVKALKLPEYSEVINNELRYAYTLTMKESCIKCHSTPQNAPKDVIERYGISSGFGFKTGDVAGIISVRIPLDFSKATLLEQFHSSGSQAYLALGLLLCALIAPLIFLEFAIIKKIKRMTEFAEAASTGKASNDDFPTNPNSKNELAVLGNSIKRMNSSLQIAMDKLRSKH